ncbi:hypothetical protein Nepgr_011991 [Nepenthes gracilis]|uniref:Katanin p80 WD40 repeat-containing subunit B1 homolog n=1 Tax=Nepenthes gracilis TaxID=150966 RepID=A0AAD3SG42_NEPGR|nr:hypothetical protein Nepgr_011991 [Nepenthes gracilis]
MAWTFTGYRSNCTTVEFYPFGEFFASSSAHKDHGLGINSVKFTPNGYWVISGGLDNVLKVWDLTVGKLLHDFKFPAGHIRFITFHLLKFLLATGSADRIVEFWDLETFEMDGSVRAEATGMHATIFHPNGRTLFCGYDGNLKGNLREPTRCHVAVDMEWSTRNFRNSIGVWVAKLSLMEPYGAGTTEDNCPMELKLDPQENHATEKVVPVAPRTPSSCSISPGFDIKEIKNIYVDYPKESNKLSAKRQSQTVAGPVKPTVQANVKSSVVSSIVPIEGPAGRDLATVRRESLNLVKDDTVDSIKPSYLWRSSSNKLHSKRQSMDETRHLSSVVDPKFLDRLVTNGSERELFEDKYPTVKTVEE